MLDETESKTVNKGEVDDQWMKNMYNTEGS